MKPRLYILQVGTRCSELPVVKHLYNTHPLLVEWHAIRLSCCSLASGIFMTQLWKDQTLSLKLGINVP